MVNNPLDTPRFPAKLLLFGEHVLLLGATALATPVPAFGGRFVFSNGEALESAPYRQRLFQFAQSDALRALGTLQLEQFAQDLTSGLYFKSNIPTGYGLGSSGALCAAVYDRYCQDKTRDFAELKRIFAQMEGFFHGNSSGIDPLTSYVGECVRIRNKTEVTLAKTQAWEQSAPLIFLLDTQLPRRTGPLVEWFLAQSEAPDFAQKLTQTYLPAHEALVQAWVSADSELFWPNLRRISAFQLEYFVPMIPPDFRKFWLENMDNQDFTLKICGAGGGGYLLGFARNLETIRALSATYKIVLPGI